MQSRTRFGRRTGSWYCFCYLALVYRYLTPHGNCVHYIYNNDVLVFNKYYSNDVLVLIVIGSSGVRAFCPHSHCFGEGLDDYSSVPTV